MDKTAELALDVGYVIRMSAHRYSRLGKGFYQIGEKCLRVPGGVGVGKEADGVDQAATGEGGVDFGKQFGGDVKRNAGGGEFLAGDCIALHIGERQALGLASGYGELAKNDLGLAFGIGQVGKGSALAGTGLIIAELINGVAAVLNGVDLDFLLAVTDCDSVGHGGGGVLSTLCHATQRPFVSY